MPPAVSVTSNETSRKLLPPRGRFVARTSTRSPDASRTSIGPSMFLMATIAVAQKRELPTRLSDSAFWQLVTSISEPSGYFRSDNFVSNETSFQYVLPDLRKTTKPGGAYLGVGPDQNFTYIAALRSRIA